MGSGPRVEDVVRPGTFFCTLQRWHTQQTHSLSYGLLLMRIWEAASWSLTSKNSMHSQCFCATNTCTCSTKSRGIPGSNEDLAIFLFRLNFPSKNATQASNALHAVCPKAMPRIIHLSAATHTLCKVLTAVVVPA